MESRRNGPQLSSRHDDDESSSAHTSGVAGEIVRRRKCWRGKQDVSVDVDCVVQLRSEFHVLASERQMQWRSRTFGRPGRWSNLPPFHVISLKLESCTQRNSSR